MAKRISQLTQLTAAQLATGDQLAIVDVSAGQTKYVTVKDLTGAPDFSWQATGESWSFSSWTAASNNGVVNVPSDATTKYSIGMWVRFSQTTGGTKWGKILSVTTTTLTIWMPSQTLNNEAITTPVYSQLAVPTGLPASLSEGQPYKFSAYRAAALTTAVGYQKMVLDTETYDTNGNFASGTFTAPVSGYYQFNWLFTISIVSTSNDTVAALYKNGVVETWGMEIESQGGTGGSDLLQLTAGDTIEMWVYTQAASAIIAAKTSTRLSGYLVSRG